MSEAASTGDSGDALGEIAEPARRVPVVARAEVLVLGGGPAGVAAALAAARLGRATVLVERYGFLGGMGTIAQVTSFCGLYAQTTEDRVRVVAGVVDDVLARLAAADALAPPHPILGRTWGQAYDTAVYKGVLDDLVIEAGVTPMLHTFAVGCAKEGDRVTALLVETKSGRRAIVAREFIDASGDADLAQWAGVPTEKGDDDGALAYPTLMFRVGRVDGARARAEGKPRLASLMAEATASGEFTFPRRSAWINPQPHDDEWRANVTQLARGGRAIDGSDAGDLTFGEIEGRRQVRSFFAFLRQRVPGFERSYLLDVAPQIGVRETRRARGRYQLVKEDVLRCRDFDDAIGLSAWPIEHHVRGDTVWTFLDGRGYGTLPLRMLVADGCPNLLVAGRCASASHDAQASIRVSGPCFVMGQAAGTLAALRCRDPANADAAGVREALLRAGARLTL